jgi:iron complex transport system ATP-binding protein
MSQLEGRNLSLSLGGQAILKQVDLTVAKGEMLGLIGPNGAGKTTLLRILAGLVIPDEGSLQLEEQPYHALDAQFRAKKIAYLSQNGTAHWPLTVERLIELGRIPHLGSWQEPNQHDMAIISDIMQQTDTLHLKARTFDTLSGGERARVLLARAMVSEPEILLADEPVAALDPAHQLDVMALLQNHCKKGGSVVVILHDLSLASHYCHRLQLILNGAVIAVGAASEVLTEKNLKQAYQITARTSHSSSTLFPLNWKKIEE